MALAADIQRVYIAYFNRPADPAGLQYWLQEIGSGGSSLQDVMNAFSTTEEYLNLYAGSTSAAVVRAVYQNLFGRDPEPAGLQYWTGEIASGNVGVGRVAYEALVSAGGLDKVTVDQKAHAAALFTDYLERDNSAGKYSGAALQEVRQWLSSVDSSLASLKGAELTLKSLLDEPQYSSSPKTFAITTGWEVGMPIKMGEVIRIEDFRFGYDKIDVSFLDGSNVVIPDPIPFYFENFSSWGGTIAESEKEKMAVFGAMGFAHHGGRGTDLAPLERGEAVVFAFEQYGKMRMFIFVDDPGDVDGDNGPNAAWWHLDADKLIDITGAVGLKLTADGLHVQGDIFI